MKDATPAAHRCYITISWAALQHTDPYLGPLAEPAVIVSLYRHDPRNLCQEPIATSIKLLPTPAFLDDSMSDAQQERIWTSDVYIDAIDPIVWSARMEIYAAARDRGYVYAHESWEGLDEIEVVDVGEVAEEPEPVSETVN